jgi:hypothetical protein
VIANKQLIALSLTLLCCAFDSKLASGEYGNTPQRDDAWREDLTALISGVRHRHPNPEHTLSDHELDQLAQELDTNIPRLSDHEIIVRMQEILAQLGEAHTYVDLFGADSRFPFDLLPVEFRIFEDGVFIVRASEQYRDLVFGRVFAIGGVDIVDALDRLRGVVSIDNGSTARFLIPKRMRSTQLLQVIGLSDNPLRATFSLELHNGATRSVELAVVTGDEQTELLDSRFEKWRDDAPLFWREPSRSYWFSHLDEARAVYLQLNSMRHDPQSPVDEFSDRLLQTVKRKKAKRLVIDLRRNTGGNWSELRPLIREIVTNESFQEPGALYLLIGRASISATVVFAQELTKYTDAILVGESSGSSPNQYGDNSPVFYLPNSGLPIAVSRAFYQSGGPYQWRDALEPDLYVPEMSKDYIEGTDPTLAVALSGELAPSFADQLTSVYSVGAAADVVQFAQDFAAQEKFKFVEIERPIRRAGAALLEAGNVAEAVEVYAVNTTRYPNRARPWVGYAEALHAASRRQEARTALDKSLAVIHEDRTLTFDLRQAIQGYAADVLLEWSGNESAQ